MIFGEGLCTNTLFIMVQLFNARYVLVFFMDSQQQKSMT